MTISGRGVPLTRWKYCALAIFPVNPGQRFPVRSDVQIVNRSALCGADFANLLTIQITKVG
jgi:hypothetical protein